MIAAERAVLVAAVRFVDADQAAVDLHDGDIAAAADRSMMAFDELVLSVSALPAEVAAELRAS